MAMGDEATKVVTMEKQRAQVALDGKYHAQFAALAARGVQAQADAFTRAFCGSLREHFPEVARMVTEFDALVKVNVARVAPAPEDGGAPAAAAAACEAAAGELEEDLAHKFLEQQGQTMTVVELREAFRDIDLSRDGRMSFVEYLLWKYDKCVAALFAEVEQEDLPILGKLEAAQADVDAHARARAEHERKIKELELVVEAGGFQGTKAAHELQLLRAKRWTKENMEQLVSQFNAKGVTKEADAAMKVYKDAQEASWQQEQEKLNQASESEKRERTEARSRLSQRISAMGLS